MTCGRCRFKGFGERERERKEMKQETAKVCNLQLADTEVTTDWVFEVFL